MAQLLRPHQLEEVTQWTRAAPVRTDEALTNLRPESELENLWTTTLAEDTQYQEIHQAVKKNQRNLPTAWKGLKLSMADLTLQRTSERLMYRNRLWVPQAEELRAKLIQQLHDSVL